MMTTGKEEKESRQGTKSKKRREKKGKKKYETSSQASTYANTRVDHVALLHLNGDPLNSPTGTALGELDLLENTDGRYAPACVCPCPREEGEEVVPFRMIAMPPFPFPLAVVGIATADDCSFSRQLTSLRLVLSIPVRCKTSRKSVGCRPTPRSRSRKEVDEG